MNQGRRPACRALSALVLVLAGGTAHAQIYKCTQGSNVVFADKPCSEGTAVKLKTQEGIPQSDIQFDAPTTHYPVTGANYGEVYRRLVSQNAGGFAAWA